MARIAFSLCGFGPIDDPRCYLPDCIRPFIPNQYSGFFQAAGDFTFNFVWRWKRLHYDFDINWTDGISSAAISASGDFVSAWQFMVTGPDESFLRCQPEFVYAIREIATDDSEIIMRFQLGEFNEISQLFTFGVSFEYISPAFGELVTSGVPPGSPSGVVCTILGNLVRMYDVSGVASGHVTITNSTLDGYWEYDNHKGGGPPNGPIWDKDDGSQLISPLPVGL